MARSPEQGERRRQELVLMLSRGRSVATGRAAHRFGVAPMTIRRDLKVLEESGLVVRRYGGAVTARRISLEFAFDRRHQRHLKEKRRIGRAAAERVEPGQTLFLDTGTTTLEVARALAQRAVPCRVVTGSLVIAGRLWGREEIELLLLGGRARRGSPDLVGAATEIMLELLTADVGFLGADGILPERGCFAEDIEAARVAERMAASARRVVVVADHSKLGCMTGVRYLKTGGMHELITDRGADKALVAALRQRRVKVTLV
jgi:DeoR/GlpR family transcriptional regulator of sugar metabolism